MSDERSRDGNGAVVAIVVVLGIVVFLGLMVVFLGGFVFWSRSSPVMMAPPAAVATVAVAPAAPLGPADDLAPASENGAGALEGDSLPGNSLIVEVDAADQILVSGKASSLADLQAVFKDIKNGNSPFTKINIKFAGSSDSKAKEVALVLKEACILYTVDPAGKVPAELEAPQ